MKTLIPLTFASLALVAFTLNVYANDALLSPRAAGNQIRTVAGTDTSPNTVTQSVNVTVSPRSLDHQIHTAKGVSNDANALVCSQRMLASPKAVGECASHPGATMSCCGVVSTK